MTLLLRCRVYPYRHQFSIRDPQVHERVDWREASGGYRSGASVLLVATQDDLLGDVEVELWSNTVERSLAGFRRVASVAFLVCSGEVAVETPATVGAAQPEERAAVAPGWYSLTVFANSAERGSRFKGLFGRLASDLL